MKGLALETVAKWIILIVVAGVVINLVFFFYEDIKNYIEERLLPRNNDIETEIVESEKFTSSQVKIYMRSCWDKTGERHNSNVICYVLKGDFTDVEKNQLLDAVDPPAKIGINEFDNTKTTSIIRFEDVGNTIILES